MEYKYQIGEIVYAGQAAHVVTAHGVHLDEGVAIPSYQVTGVNVPVGTRNLPLTDESIHRPSGFKGWYTGAFFLDVDEHLEKLITDNEEIKVKLEQSLQDTEEKIKRFKGLLNQDKEDSYGYVIRTHSSPVPTVIIGYVARHGRIGYSGEHSARKVYASELVAIEDAARYNKSQPGCFAVVIPNGTERYCRTAEPVWKEDQ